MEASGIGADDGAQRFRQGRGDPVGGEKSDAPQTAPGFRAAERPAVAGEQGFQQLFDWRHAEVVAWIRRTLKADLTNRTVICAIFKPVKVEIQKHIEYASGYLDLKMFDEALREADVALALAPSEPHALGIKSAILWEQNRLKEAEPFMAQLAELNPHNTGLWINLAYIRRRTQSVEAAAATLQRAFHANPRDALANFNMACYRAVQNRPEEALELLRDALQIDPKLRAMAKAEADFQTLRGLPAFEKLLTGRG